MSCIAGCQMRDRHVGSCPCGDPSHTHTETTTDAAGCDQCRGCLPAQTDGALLVCRRCSDATRAALKELPQLWADLAERPRLSGVSIAIEGDGEGDLPGLLIGAKAVENRSTIRAHLVTWVQILHDKHQMPAPDEMSIARSTRGIVVYHSELARQSREAAMLLAAPAVGPLQPSADGYAAMKEDAADHLEKAEAARHERLTGFDVTRALAAHIDRHIDRLLTDPDDAPVIVADLTTAHRSARRAANPSRGANMRILCSCGSRVPVDPDEIMTCPGCGNYGVLNWWVQHEAPTHADPMSLTELHGWLILKGVIIHQRKLRDWADKGLITPVSGGEGKRRLYDPQAVLIVGQMSPARRNAIATVKVVA